MKKSLKKLQINKEVVTNFDAEKVKGGWSVACNSKQIWEGGIGCHIN